MAMSSNKFAKEGGGGYTNVPKDQRSR